LVFTDIEIIYWTVNGHWMVFRLNPYQSTSEAKINDGKLPGKSMITLFILFGNYFYIRRNALKTVGYFRLEPGFILLSNVNAHLFLQYNWFLVVAFILFWR